MAYERLKRKLTKENLWIYILRLLKDGSLYGYQLREEVYRRFGFKPGRVTCYVVVNSLKKAGYISLESEVSTKEGPPRKYYVITRKGTQALDTARQLLGSLQDKLS